MTIASAPAKASAAPSRWMIGEVHRADAREVAAREARCRVERREEMHAPPRDERRSATPPTNERSTLSVSELPDEAAAPGADGESHGDLAPAAGRAHEKQIGDVGAGDEQHEPDGAEQHEQRLRTTGSTRVASSGRAVAPQCSSLISGCGYAASTRAPSCGTTPSPARRETPGARRAIEGEGVTPRLVQLAPPACDISGVHNSARPESPRKPGGSTPTIVYGSPSMIDASCRAPRGRR